jgi:hypothetical protein
LFINLFLQKSSLLFVKKPVLILKPVRERISFRLSLRSFFSQTVGESTLSQSDITTMVKALHCLFVVPSFKHLDTLSSPSFSPVLLLSRILLIAIVSILCALSQLFQKLPLLFRNIPQAATFLILALLYQAFGH